MSQRSEGPLSKADLLCAADFIRAYGVSNQFATDDGRREYRALATRLREAASSASSARVAALEDALNVIARCPAASLDQQDLLERVARRIHALKKNKSTLEPQVIPERSGSNFSKGQAEHLGENVVPAPSDEPQAVNDEHRSPAARRQNPGRRVGDTPFRNTRAAAAAPSSTRQSNAEMLENHASSYDGMESVAGFNVAYDIRNNMIPALLETPPFATAPSDPALVSVPREPTDEMMRAGWNAYCDDMKGGLERFAITYRAMLAAAPAQKGGDRG